MWCILDSKLCSSCQDVESSGGVFQSLKDQGLNVVKYTLEDDTCLYRIIQEIISIRMMCLIIKRQSRLCLLETLILVGQQRLKK